MRSWLPWIVLLTLVLLAPGRPHNEPAAPRITQIYGPRHLSVDRVDNYRVRIAPGAEQPVVYRWTMGDGTQAAGNNVSHRYSRPGTYWVVATARNAHGRDADSILVRVTSVPEDLGEPPLLSASAERVVAPAVTEAAGAAGTAPPADGLRARGAIDWSRGGYTLLVSTQHSPEAAEAVALNMKVSGFRSGIVVDDEGPGSTVYRVVVGQFATSAEAVAARQQMLKDGRKGAFLVYDLPGLGP